MWAGYPTWAQPPDEAWAPLQAVPAVGPGAQQEHSAASCSRGNRARRAAFHLQVDPRRSAQACVWSPRHPPHQQPPYVQPGDGQPGGECLACDLDVHTLPGTTGPGHAVTTRGTCNRALPRGRPQSRWAAGRGGRCSPRGFCSPVSWGWARGLGKAGEGAGDGQGRGPVSTGVLGPSSSPGLQIPSPTCFLGCSELVPPGQHRPMCLHPSSRHVAHVHKDLCTRMFADVLSV